MISVGTRSSFVPLYSTVAYSFILKHQAVWGILHAHTMMWSSIFKLSHSACNFRMEFKFHSAVQKYIHPRNFNLDHTLIDFSPRSTKFRIKYKKRIPSHIRNRLVRFIHLWPHAGRPPPTTMMTPSHHLFKSMHRLFHHVYTHPLWRAHHINLHHVMLEQYVRDF
jgi:hypothetical protein